jgi:iron complex outermembrane receptor protein
MSISAQIRLTTIAVVLIIASPCSAQTQDALPPDDAAREMEVVYVTGTRITRRDYASPSPVYTVSGEDIRLQGLPTLETVLNRLPQFSPSYGRTNNYYSGGEIDSPVNLRGLGANRNLVLLDGRRLGPSGTSGVINLNSLPAVMVERIEVLSGGASAVYGSDAMSGVVNFITRRDFEGLELSGNYEISDEGDADVWSVNAAGGLSFAGGRGHVSGFLDYYEREPLMASERDFSSRLLTDDAYANYWGDLDAPITGSFSPWGSYSTPEGLLPIGAIYDGEWAMVSLNDDGTPRAAYIPDDLYDYAPDYRLQGELERFSGRVVASYQFSDRLQGRIELLGSHHEDSQLWSAAAGETWLQVNLDNPILTPETRQLFADNYQYYDDGMAEIFLMRRFSELGARSRHVDWERDNWRVSTALDGLLASGWTWQFSYDYIDQTKDGTFHGGVHIPRLQQALLVDPATGECFDTSDGCVPADVFGAGRLSADAVNFLRAPNSADHSEVTTHQLSLFAEGEVSTGLALPMSLGLGLDLRSEDGSYKPGAELLEGNVWGFPQLTAADGDYDMAEVYIEAYLPLLRDTDLAKELSLEAGLRYSDHSVADDIWTWKTGLSWSPREALRLRAMFQRAVRAPNLEEMYLTTVDQVYPAGPLPEDVRDPCSADKDPIGNGYKDLCVAQGIPADQVGTWEADPLYQRTHSFGGSQDLDPEEADTLTVGFVWQPDQFEDLSVALDWYRIEIDDAIEWMSSDDAMDTCFEVGQVNSEYCQSFNRVADGNIDRQRGTFRNLAKLTAEGVDLQADYGFEAPGSVPGRLRLSLLANWNAETSFQTTDRSPEYRCEGRFGSPCNLASLGTFPEFRTVTTLAYDYREFTVQFLWHWIDEVENAWLSYPESWLEPGGKLAADRIDSTSYYDLNTSWQLTPDVRLIAGIINLTDEDPPLYGAQSIWFNTDPSMYDTLGRRYHVAVHWHF